MTTAEKSLTQNINKVEYNAGLDTPQGFWWGLGGIFTLQFSLAGSTELTVLSLIYPVGVKS
jgi:hypothetical protein